MPILLLGQEQTGRRLCGHLMCLQSLAVLTHLTYTLLTSLWPIKRDIGNKISQSNWIH